MEKAHNETDRAGTGKLSRRHLLLAGSVAAGASLLPRAGLAQTIGAASGDTRMQGVEFDNNGITMAGNVCYPPGFDASNRYPAIVSIHPGGGVKEQTAGLYAERLAAEGFVTLAFDASHQGASGGMPRYLDDPMRRTADIFSAVDYLTSLAFVDGARIGAIGICAGTGAAVKAAGLERRIRAVATVSGVDVGALQRRGWNGEPLSTSPIGTLEAVAMQRTAELGGAAPVYGNYVPALGDTSAPRDLQEAADYYLTPRGQHPNAPNRMLLTGAAFAVGFNGFGEADLLLTQPVLIVAGSEAGSLWHSEELHAKAASTDKELFIVEGATHMDLYDGEGVDRVMAKVGPFFIRKLT